jgi:hypothetical protein
MGEDKDFHRAQLKVNAAGSWANVLTCKTDDYDRVKTACLVLAECATTPLKFKLLDAEGGTLEVLECSRDTNYQYAWREPHRAR